MKILFKCWSCGKEYDSETIPYQHGYKCDCGGYVISPSGKIQGRWEEDKNHGGFETTWKEFVEKWSKFQKDWEGYFSQEGIKCPRVWDDVLGKMIYSTVEQFDDMLGFRFSEHLETENPVYMWPTGLRDKNRREIYEGDIVLVGNHKQPAIVEYDEGCFYTPIGISRYRLGWWQIDVIEVIGNIYENPELLKGEETA